MNKLILIIVFLLLASARAWAGGEPCQLELTNVPIGAIIRATAYWKSDDPDEALEDEGYVFEVIAGGTSSMRIWQQPFMSSQMAFFFATDSTVVIEGHKDPTSVGHSEGTEVEGCEIAATINAIPAWIKSYAAASLRPLGYTLAGMGVLALGYPVLVPAAKGLGLFTAVATLLSRDPVDCSSPAQVFPLFQDSIGSGQTDAISVWSDRIARNGMRTVAIARAAITNANRAACPSFSNDQKLALFARAQTQGARIGRHVARLINRQLPNLVIALQQAGIQHDEQKDSSFVDWWFGFTSLYKPWRDPTLLDSQLLTVLSATELDALTSTLGGIPTVDFNTNTLLFPFVWPDGAAVVYPALGQWSASLIAKEAQ